MFTVLRRNVPYNPLLDQGYRSIGDWHSTAKPDPSATSNSTSNGDAGERAGRWQGKKKSECGLHKDYFQMKRAFEEKRREAVEVAQDNGVDVQV
jgi:phosphoadenosine phosphosulfate reductase